MPSTGSPAREPRETRAGISPQTLIIASVASAAASFTVARLWGPGTLAGAAAAPVIVALVAEFLRRPVRTVAATAKRVPTARHPDTRPRPDPRPHPDGRPQPHTTRRRPRWRAAVATGLLSFAIVVGVFTVPDLLAGHSITGNGRQTTFFGSSSIVQQTTSPATTGAITTAGTHTSPAPTTATAHTATALTTATQTAATATATQTAAATSTASTPVTTQAPRTTSPTTSTPTP